MILTIIFLVSPVQLASSSENWTWSTDLQNGRTYLWKVEKYQIDNLEVLRADASTGWMREGSIIMIELLKAPSELNWLNASQSGINSYFNDSIDGIHHETLNINLFIFPVSFSFGNGSQLNVFEEAAREKGFFYYFIGAKNIKIEDNELIQTFSTEGTEFKILAEVNSGILNYYHVKLDSGFEILIRRFYEKQDSGSSNILNELLFIIFGSVLLIIVTYRFERIRKNRRRTP
ncbi:MAG: hypothetical protein ACXAD7_09230 [Candidatus Kariarchaeaceae archaeon]